LPGWSHLKKKRHLCMLKGKVNTALLGLWAGSR
jgi:hypothetical protein